MWYTVCQAIGAYLLCAIATERATEVITTGEIFAWLRNLLGRLAFGSEGTLKLKPNKFWVFWHKLVTCSYCASHWLAMVFVWFLPGQYYLFAAADNFVVKWIALVGLSNLYHAMFSLVYRGRVLTADLVVRYPTDEGEEE